ncbi:Helix-turn-helix domain-containing protein [Cnuella takakiae]|uniref:Helix-turn-helix domain-containing protein n=1 Tax=Cnuella takakiae TaxID=1302690 RepID=A0A1M4Z4I0_9BACT|nr:response regulator transcription factor [Cnuella takakiae]OLY94336.1 AraC family transcriptional regulator [Cnuella takakiae]SHF12885.1 Helix-turn-helix domain-containing protein [Cnuella takakiae]
MNKNHLLKIESLTQLHSILGLDKPVHPLVSLVKLEDVKITPGTLPEFLVVNFYKVAYKMDLSGAMKYGQNYYDFGEGGLVFTAPNQPFQSPDDTVKSGYILFIHPDFLLSYPLAKKVNQYGFFSYAANEALHLSEHEKATIISIFKVMQEELHSRIDDFSQEIVISQVELLLSYSHRFYKRQFITRKAVNNELLHKLDTVLDDYFSNEKPFEQGLPTVQYLAAHVNLSPSYLSDMLRSLTGQNAQQHIHHKLIEKAKELLSTTHLTVSEVAYQLGFEHPQSFSKLFKTKAKLSPLAFRQSFN